MTLLVSEEDLREDITEAMLRGVKTASNSFMGNEVRPMSISLSSSGESLLVSLEELEEVFTGEGSVRLEYNIPKNEIESDSTGERRAGEIIDSDALQLVKRVVESMFDYEPVFRVVESSASMVVFHDYVTVTDPGSVLPVEEEYEIVPVVSVDVTKQWVYLHTSRDVFREVNGDLILTEDKCETEVEFGEEVTLLGEPVTVQHDHPLNSGIGLVDRNGDVFARVSGMTGDWTRLITESGEQ